jgi:hypothetical protein
VRWTGLTRQIRRRCQSEVSGPQPVRDVGDHVRCTVWTLNLQLMGENSKKRRMAYMFGHVDETRVARYNNKRVARGSSHSAYLLLAAIFHSISTLRFASLPYAGEPGAFLRSYILRMRLRRAHRDTRIVVTYMWPQACRSRYPCVSYRALRYGRWRKSCFLRRQSTSLTFPNNVVNLGLQDRSLIIHFVTYSVLIYT